MRKQLIALLLALVMLLAACGSGEPTTTEQNADTPPATEQAVPTEENRDPVLDSLQQGIGASGALFGVAYLGYAELPSWTDVCVYVEAGGFAKVYPFLNGIKDDHAVLQEGGEVYAVVPASGDVTLTVSEYLMEDLPYRGEDLLTVSDGQPLLLRGNISDIVPNLLITAQQGEMTIEYNPCISGMDGSLVTQEGVYDFTPYDLFGGYDWVPDEAFTGTWYARHYDGNNNQMAMTLTLEPDGYAEFGYGEPDSEGAVHYDGSWTSHGDAGLTLELTGGVPGEESSKITCDFTWEIQGYALVLHHEKGSPLLAGTEEARYNFLSFNGFHMVNNWTSAAEYRDWFYNLQLYDNGECSFSIHEVNGGELVGYEGWWYLSEEYLNLNLLLSRGEHPESPEMDFIYGTYRVENWQPGSMTLLFDGGHILTLDMEENYEAHFFGD